VSLPDLFNPNGDMTPEQARAKFANLRKLVRFDKDGVCPFEEAFVDQLRREHRVPSAMTGPDGFGTGGGDGRGGAELTSVESAASQLISIGSGETADPDQFGADVLAACDFLTQAELSANAVRRRVHHAATSSTVRASLGRTVAMCCEVGTRDEPCGEIATSGDKSKWPGRCEPHRKWLERATEKALEEGFDPPRSVTREAVDEGRTSKRRGKKTMKEVA
jgi:hypothetical protein